MPTMRPVPVLDPLDVILHTRVKGLRRDLVVLRADLQDLFLRPCELPGIEVVSAPAPLRVPLSPIAGVFGFLCGRVCLFVISPLCGLYIAPGTAEPSLVLVADSPCAIFCRHVRVYVRCHLLPVLLGLALQECPVVMFAGSLPAVMHARLHADPPTTPIFTYTHCMYLEPYRLRYIQCVYACHAFIIVKKRRLRQAITQYDLTQASSLLSPWAPPLDPDYRLPHKKSRRPLTAPAFLCSSWSVPTCPRMSAGPGSAHNAPDPP